MRQIDYHIAPAFIHYKTVKICWHKIFVLLARRPPVGPGFIDPVNITLRPVFVNNRFYCRHSSVLCGGLAGYLWACVLLSESIFRMGFTLLGGVNYFEH